MLDNVKMDTEAGTTDDCGGVSGEPRNSQKYLQKSSKILFPGLSTVELVSYQRVPGEGRHQKIRIGLKRIVKGNLGQNPNHQKYQKFLTRIVKRVPEQSEYDFTTGM